MVRKEEGEIISYSTSTNDGDNISLCILEDTDSSIKKEESKRIATTGERCNDWRSTANAMVVLPHWVDQLRPTWGERLIRPEWEDSSLRREGGWLGQDLCHATDSPVRILDYYTTPSVVTGVVYFSPRAESHRGFCHGGSMCSVMDDILGWTAFLLAPQHRQQEQQQQERRHNSWNGYTAQVNVSLKKPVPVHSVLLLQGSITKREGTRKVFVKAHLVNPDCNNSSNHNGSSTGSHGAIHAIGEGLVLLHKE